MLVRTASRHDVPFQVLPNRDMVATRWSTMLDANRKQA